MKRIFQYQLQNTQQGVLVERKAMVSSNNIELHYYETIEKAEKVMMQFNSPVIALMLRGEKIIEMEELGRFEYKKGESLIVPSGKSLSIDFPNASIENPTQCLAFVPDSVLVEEATYDFYQKTNKLEEDLESEVDFSTDLLLRDEAILRTVNYLMMLLSENNEHRDLFINLKTKELIIRILQSKARKAFLHTFSSSNNRMNHVARYIRDNIHKSITVQELSEEAGMSKSGFFTLFKNTFGLTPNEYVIQTKIEKAKFLIRHSSHKSISEIAFDLGYSNNSYFTKQFKQVTGLTPSQYWGS